jgi:hypothetical protein
MLVLNPVFGELVMSNVAFADAVVADAPVADAVVAPAVDTPVVAKVRAERKPNVSDENIIKVWQKMARRVDADGVKNGTIQAAADELGMNKASLNQRITSLRELGLQLEKMPRAKGGGKKKDLSELQALLALVNEGLTVEDETEGDSEGETEGQTAE